MRRVNRPVICQPGAVSGEEVAARAAQRNPFAAMREPGVTGSLGGRKALSYRNPRDEEYEDD